MSNVVAIAGAIVPGVPDIDTIAEIAQPMTGSAFNIVVPLR